MRVIPKELQNDPNYDFERFPRAFEENLLMVLRPNHLYAERLNLQNKFDVDFAIKRTKDNELLFYAEAEYDASGKVFDEKGEITYDTINILARKAKFFEKEKPTYFVKGNLRYVFVVDGEYVLRHGVVNNILCSFRKWNAPISTATDFLKNVKYKEDKVIQIDKSTAFNQGFLGYGPLERWLEIVKRISDNLKRKWEE